VVIKIHASGMCGTDLHVHHGRFGLTPPIVAGHEPVGEIVELGAASPIFAWAIAWACTGTRRLRPLPHCQSGNQYACAKAQSWIHLGGGNSELMLAWASGCALIPEGLATKRQRPSSARATR